MRILITGSRSWTDRDLVRGAIASQVTLNHDKEVVIVHGDCPHGADRMAKEFCWEARIREERHPAKWDLHGRSAGFRRNAEMVALGADLLLAFWDGESRGTLDCLTRAVKAGIPVRVIPKPKP